MIKQHLKEEKDALDNQKGALKKNFFRYTMPFCHFTGFNLWLLKPTKLNRGRGIHVINNLTQLKGLIQRYCEGWKPTGPTAAAAVTNNVPKSNALKEEKMAIVPEELPTFEHSPDKDGNNDMATDEEEEPQPSTMLPPLPAQNEET